LMLPTKAVVHPLVLLSSVDHYNRVSKDTKKRVIGVLLGEIRKIRNEVIVDITNSYAVPFEEDEAKMNIWFLDHNFHESMEEMYRKVNARERVVGWYSTGSKLKPNDVDINEVLRKYTPNPVMVLIDVQPKETLEIPTKAYISMEEVKEGSTEAPKLTFSHITSEIGALEAEEVGVEHLLRDIKDTSVSTLATHISGRLNSLKSLISHLQEMKIYLENVAIGKLPINHQIIGNMQDIFNLLPNLNVEEMSKSFSTKTNDMMFVIYLSSLIRSILALHNLINNKIENRDAEKKAENPQADQNKKTSNVDATSNGDSSKANGSANNNNNNNNNNNSNNKDKSPSEKKENKKK